MGISSNFENPEPLEISGTLSRSIPKTPLQGCFCEFVRPEGIVAFSGKNEGLAGGEFFGAMHGGAAGNHTPVRMVK